MKHFLFYLIALTVCLPFASCSDEFVELPYAYDEISYRRGYDLDIPLETVIYIESQAEFEAKPNLTNFLLMKRQSLKQACHSQTAY